MLNFFEFAALAVILTILYNEWPVIRPWIILLLVVVLLDLTMLHYSDIRSEFIALSGNIKAKARGQHGATR